MDEHHNAEGAGAEPAPDTQTPAAGGFDFGQFDISASAERGATFTLRNPRNGNVTGVTFLLHGGDARSYRNNVRRMRDAVAAAPEREPTDVDDALLLNRARDAACSVISWHGVMIDGRTLEFTQENAVELFRRYDWAADAVLAFVNNRGNF